jgi:RNA-directed DNA polymerase
VVAAEARSRDVALQNASDFPGSSSKHLPRATREIVGFSYWLRHVWKESSMWPSIGIVVVVLVAILIWRWSTRRRVPLTVSDAIARLDLSEADVQTMKQMAYREVAIPKRNGGMRHLQIPDDPTREMQRRILHRLLRKARCHRAAVGFELGKSIVHAARPHTGKAMVIRVDIVDFFNSTTAERVQDWFQRSGWERPAAEFLTRCVTHNGVLPQGAPTSPRLSNLVNARMDGALWHLARRYKGHYTRYADDITLSFSHMTARQSRAVVQVIRRVLKRFGYRMHGSKTRILRSHQCQQVLGLTVNQQVAIPRKMRRKLRAARHNKQAGRAATFTDAQLEGWAAFERMVQKQR